MSSEDYAHGTVLKEKKHFVDRFLNYQNIALISAIMVIFGSWLNAQGGWVKDFSYNRVVVLPFLTHDYYTSGFNWYLVGLLDDLVGVGINVFGLLVLKRVSFLKNWGKINSKLFLYTIAIYVILDLLAFWNFSNYYSGNTSLSLYGQYWNIIQYFGMLPAFFVTDFLLLIWKPKGNSSTYNGRKEFTT